MTVNQILSKCIKKEFNVLCGIYFLIKDEKVVYIGKSINVYSRVATHVKKIDFDYFLFYECKESQLSFLERTFIETFFPVHNIDPLTRSKKMKIMRNELEGKEMKTTEEINLLNSLNSYYEYYKYNDSIQPHENKFFQKVTL